MFHKVVSEEAARAKARVIEADLSRRAPLRPADGPRTVTALAAAYRESLEGRSRRYQERQADLLGRWVLPHLGRLEVGAWSAADSERLLNLARRRLAPASVQNLGSVLRSLVTYAHKARWLPGEVDPMWHVSYSAKATHQGQAVGFVVRAELPNDDQCAAFFSALVEMGHPTWALAGRLAYRSGARWGELVALRPMDISFEPHRLVRVARAVEQSRGGLAFKTTKNSQARSTIFPASLAPDLQAHVTRVTQEHGDEGLLFPGGAGAIAARRYFIRLWHRAAGRAGWPMHHPTRSVWHPHDLRHVAACWMLFDLRLDAAVVARMLGHSNPAFTLSRYVRVRTGADATTNELTEVW